MRIARFSVTTNLINTFYVSAQLTHCVCVIHEIQLITLFVVKNI